MEALTEIGQIGVTDAEGNEFLFNPSFANIAKIGNTKTIVKTFHDLHGPKSVRPAMHVMRCCAVDNADDLIGWLDEYLHRVDGSIPDEELVILARSLMTDGVAGRAKPDKKDSEGK